MADVTDNAQPVEGAAAHDAPAAENPVGLGLRANANEPGAVQDGDAVWAWGDRSGRQVVVQGHPSPDAPDAVTLTATGDTALKTAPGAGQSIHVLLLTASNTSGTDVRLDIKDGATVKFSFMLAANGGGFVLPIPAPGWKLTANTALNVAISAAVTDVRVSAVTYIAP